MAPLKPKSSSRRVTPSFQSPLSTFSTTKKDKRIMKHSLLVSKARTSSDKPSGIKKRRRPAKKLTTNISSLADALPDELMGESTPSQSSKISMAGLSSLKVKKGVQKKRQKVMLEEKERFGKNLAVLSQATPSSEQQSEITSANAPDSRWAALRRHLEGTIGKS